MTSCKNCNCTRLGNMKVGEQYPVFISIGEWLESVGSRTAVSAKPVVSIQSDPNAPTIQIDNVVINAGTNEVSMYLSCGAPSVLYTIDVAIETCEGHIGRVCFEQYVEDC